MKTSHKNNLDMMTEIINVLQIIQPPLTSEQRFRECLKKYRQKQYQDELPFDTVEESVSTYFESNLITVIYNEDRYGEFIDKEASASVMTNTITVFPNLIGRIKFWVSGYEKENPYQRRNIKSDKDYRIWCMCHEYSHLLYPTYNHTDRFFMKVEELFIKYKSYIKHQLNYNYDNRGLLRRILGEYK